ncbi:MAG: replicative DNA helicase [Candidatus Hodarchaeota archaeon]
MLFYDSESEQIVLAGMLLNEKLLVEAITNGSSKLFYHKLFRVFYELIVKTYRKHQSIIVPKVISKILDKHKASVDIKRKYAYLIDKLTTKKITEIEFKLALETLKDKYLRRQLLDMSNIVVNNIEDDDIYKVYTDIEDYLTEIQLQIDANKITKEGDIKDIDERLKIYEDVRKNPGKFKGVPSGWTDLDQITDGFNPGELALIVAKQGGGKSIALLNWAYNAWMNGKNVVYITLEMPKIQVERRFDARATATKYYKIKTQKLSKKELQQFEDKLKSVIKNRKNLFYIVDISQGATPLMIASKLKQLSKKFKIDLVVIDYLGLLNPTTKKKDIWEGVLEIANDLKRMARTFHVPILTASQLTSKGLSKTQGKRKTYDLEDIALTRRLADACDIILGLKPDMLISQAYVNIIKYRDGTGPMIKLFIDFDRCLICDLEEEDDAKE